MLPIALPLEHLIARTTHADRDLVRFGTISAFHERKELETVARAFRAEFAGRDDVELTIHSNLAFGDVHERVLEVAESATIPRITVTNEHLTPDERDRLLESFDVFVNCSRGEGYSIGAREALALGKALVLSDIGVHRDIGDAPGVFRVPTSATVPAYYPEIDHRIFGRQQRVSPNDVRRSLRDADQFVRSDDHLRTLGARRRLGAQFSFDRLSIEYASVIDPDVERTRLGRQAERSPITSHPAASTTSTRVLAGARPNFRNTLLIPAHDGGFFSVFNPYISHVVWGLQDDRCHRVLPDWDQRRLSERTGSDFRESFCYGRFSDGNIWTHLFEPVFGCTVEQMNDVEFLSENSFQPEAHFNERLEPTLTYYHAYDLYHSPWFPRLRRQYHEAYRRHIRLLPHLQHEIDSFVADQVGDRRLLAAHVKHPSHVIEQPNALMAAQDEYVSRIRRYLAEHSIDAQSDDWRLFLGTDQDAVVQGFAAEFGHRVIAYPDVRRTTAEEDTVFQNATQHDKAIVGFQVQHLVASSPDNWSVEMAQEVIRDAGAMSRAEVLFHVVSNVATAVSYMNPWLEMQFVEPARSGS